MKAFLAVLALAWLTSPAAAGSALPPIPTTDKACAPVDGLSFICGTQSPEDAIAIPDTRWLVVSGMKPGAGLGIVDERAKTAYFLYTEKTPKTPNRLYPGCAAAPDPATFDTHGLSLRKTAPGRYMLYAVSHGTPESVQIFELDARGDVPTLRWKGCVAMPNNYPGNSVVSFADGSMLVTVLGFGKFGDSRGGAVFAWSPGDKLFHQLKGTELPSPNGIEIARDEKEFYVLSTLDQTFNVFSRDGRKLRSIKTLDFNPDNIRWNGNRLFAAGMVRDEPACGGVLVWNGKNANCHRGYMVAEIDPQSLQWKMIAYAEPNAAFDGVASGVIVGDTLWLTSWKSDRIAYRPLPGAGLQ